MVWRRSSAMAGFLEQLAGMFRELPRELLAASAAGAVPQASTAAAPGRP
jgi:LysR family transcriptional regulator, hydrogen peroxide-inducible genes activator